MEKSPSDVDFEFLRYLSSLNSALTQSVTDPVTLNFQDESSTLYDRHEDKKAAQKEMQYRIDVAYGDIMEHHRLHRSFLGSLRQIDRYIETQNRRDIALESNELCTMVGNYVSGVVRSHRSALGNNSFLNFPHYVVENNRDFQIKGRRTLGNIVFNHSKTAQGVVDYLNIIHEHSIGFAASSEEIPITSIETQPDSGSGYNDQSFRGRFELNKRLLSRIGFNL